MMKVGDMARRVGRWVSDECGLLAAALDDPLTKKVLLTAGGAIILLGMGTHAASATTNVDLEPAFIRINDYITGSGGKIAAGVALLTAMGGSIFQFNLKQTLGAVGVGAMGTLGIPVVTNGYTALI